MSAETATTTTAPPAETEKKVQDASDPTDANATVAETGEKRKAEHEIAGVDTVSDEKKQKVDDTPATDAGAGAGAGAGDKGKGKSTEEAAPAPAADEDDDDEDEDDPIIVSGKRRTRTTVDYSDPAVWKKAGVDPDAPDEDDEDGDANPASTDDEDVEEGESGVVAGDDDDDEDDEE